MKKCSGCGRDIRKGETYFQQVTAWVANEKRDSVTLRKDVQPWKYACKSCVFNWQHGVNDEQGALL